MKISIKDEPKEPEIVLSLRPDNKQVTLVANTASSTTLNNYLAWVTEEGRFVVNESAVKRVGLTLVHYTGASL